VADDDNSLRWFLSAVNLAMFFAVLLLSIIKYNSNIAALLSRRDFGCRKPVFAKLGSEERVYPSGVLKIGFDRIIKAL